MSKLFSALDLSWKKHDLLFLFFCNDLHRLQLLEYTHICLCLNVSTRAYVLTGSPQDIKGPWIICPAGGPTGIHTFSHTQTHNCSSQKALWLAACKLFRGRHNYNSLLSSIPVSGQIVRSLWTHIKNTQRICCRLSAGNCKPKCLQTASWLFFCPSHSLQRLTFLCHWMFFFLAHIWMLSGVVMS